MNHATILKIIHNSLSPYIRVQEKRYMEMPRDWEEKINREKINAGSSGPTVDLSSAWLGIPLVLLARNPNPSR